MNPQPGRGLGEIALRVGQHADDHLTLRVSQRAVRWRCRLRRRPYDLLRQLCRSNRDPRRQVGGARQHIFEFPYIARPGVMAQEGEHFCRGLQLSKAEVIQQMPAQQGQVFRPLP